MSEAEKDQRIRALRQSALAQDIMVDAHASGW